MKSECNFFGLRLEEQTFPHNAQCIPTNVVTFFVKIAEMTMARLTNVYFSLVESQ